MSTNNLPAQASTNKQVDPMSLPPVQLGIQDSHGFSLAQRVATLFANSSLVPTQYQGNMPNCFIALNMATRLKADPMMVIQNLYIVHGRPSWSAQFMIALFNQSDRFDTLRYKPVGEKGKDSQGYIAYATDLKLNEVIEGPEITVGLAKANGWWSKIDKYGKESSKWPVMTDMMLRYRAASWFIRAYAPEMAMGIQTVEEVTDTYEVEQDKAGTYSLPQRGQSSSDLNAMLHAEPPAAEPVIIPELERVKTEQELQDERDFAERLAAKKGRHDFLEPEEPPTRKRHTAAELEEMRADMVAEIAEKGLDLGEIEKTVGEYSNKWNAAQIERVRGKVVPNLVAELLGA